MGMWVKQPRNDITAPLRDWAVRRQSPHRIALSESCRSHSRFEMALSHYRISSARAGGYGDTSCRAGAPAITGRTAGAKHEVTDHWLSTKPGGRFSQAADGGLRESRHKISRSFATRIRRRCTRNGRCTRSGQSAASTAFHCATRSACAASTASLSPVMVRLSILSPPRMASTTAWSSEPSTSPNTVCLPSSQDVAV